MNRLVNYFLPKKYKESYYEHLKSIGLIYLLLAGTGVLIINFLLRIGVTTKSEGIYQMYIQPLLFILSFILTLFLLRNFNPKIAKNFFGSILIYLQMLMMYLTRTNGYAVEKFVGGFYIILVLYIVTALYMTRAIFLFNTLIIIGFTIFYYIVSAPLMDEKELYLAKKGLIYVETAILISAVILYVIFTIFHKAEEREKATNEKLKQQNQQLTILLDKISKALGTLLELIEQIQNLSQRLNSDASRQAVATEQTAQATEEFQQIFVQIINNSNKTLNLTKETSNILTTNKKAFNDTQQVVLQIKDKVNFIQKIAKKSDILAINASIEANKYGDDAKGFKVIASEIRNLSVQIFDYSEQIKALVENNYKLTTQSLNTLDEFMNEFNKLIAAVQNISSEIENQKGIIDQVNSSITDINSAAQNTANAAEQLKSAIDKLSELTDTLQSAKAQS